MQRMLPGAHRATLALLPRAYPRDAALSAVPASNRFEPL